MCFRCAFNCVLGAFRVLLWGVLLYFSARVNPFGAVCVKVSVNKVHVKNVIEAEAGL